MARLPIPWRVRTAWERFQLKRPRLASAQGTVRLSDRAGRATLVALGDIALSGAVGERFERDGPEAPLGSLLPLLDSAEVRVGNLETLLSDAGVVTGSLGSRIRARPAAVEVLVRARMDAVTVANNHCLDFGPDALTDSIALLDRHGIPSAGAGEDDDSARAPVVFERAGVRIGMLAYCDDHAPCEGAGVSVAESWQDGILRNIASLRPQVDLVLVQLHWGYEFQLYPMLGHRDRARQCADAGADLVLCHHAHVPMGVETRGRSIIAHGLGNALFPNSDYMRHGHPLTNRGLVLEVAFDEGGICRATLHPTALRPEGRVDLLAGRERDGMLRLFGALSRGVNDDRRLASIESDRTLREGTRIGTLLVQLATEGDPRLEEAVAPLRLPRQRELIDRLGRMVGTGAVHDLLRIAVETPAAAISGSIADCARSGAATELAAWRSRLRHVPIPPGRTP